MKYYLVGIKGSGMAGLAQILFSLGHEVKGADVEKELFVEYNLKEKGIQIDSFENMDYKDSDVIIVGNAYLDKFVFPNKVVKTYQCVLSEIVDKFYSIAVCGTHGKTTTTNMIKKVLNEYYGCNYLVGDGQGYAKENNKYFVFEACEHRDHFLSYNPSLIVCLNVDFDHVEYFKNKSQYKKSFSKFFLKAKEKLILSDTISFKNNKRLSFGLNKGNVIAKNIKYTNQGIIFDLKYNKETSLNLYLPFYGKHMLTNALACISCCLYLNVPISKIINSLKTYKEAGRRYNISFIKNSVIIDDYGHHPQEILATINAINQEFNDKKLYIVYHPDRPKRLTHFKNGYLKAFKKADKTFVLNFLNDSIEAKNAYQSIINFDNILPFSDSFYELDFSNSVILFTGSKEMKKIILKVRTLI